MTTQRTATVTRETRESRIEVTIDLDGTGTTKIATGVPFFDHMLTALGHHAGWDLSVQATGDIEIESHHTVEDTAIVLGQALRQALGDKKGITRFASASIPMDEALAEAIVDVSGRAYCVHAGEPEHMLSTTIAGHASAPYFTVINKHVFETLAMHAQMAIHIRVHYGRDPHHITEAEYKALARALRAATALDPTVHGIPSTKGAL